MPEHLAQTEGPPAEPAAAHESPSGLAHVATVSFLASRISPAAGFFLALAGGVALARVGQRRGLREGYGASFAAMLQSVAIMGPARLSIPLTQGLNAPLVGSLEGRGVGPLRQILAAAAIRLALAVSMTAFFIWVVVGLDAFVGTYDKLASWAPVLRTGTAWALGLNAGGLLVWTAFASTVQVMVYRRGLRAWPEDALAGPDRAGAAPSEPELHGAGAAPSEPEPELAGSRRFDPRAVAFAAAIAFVLLLFSTAWALLAAVSAWLAAAWLLSRPDRDVTAAGAVIGGVLALSALGFSLAGGLGLDVALRRAARAGLLVAVATWLRAAAGSGGLREVSRRVLRRLDAVPSIPQAARALDELGAGRELAPAARAAVGAIGGARKRLLPIVDAILAWIPREAAHFRRSASARGSCLRVRFGDALLVMLAAAPAGALAGLT